MQNAKGITKFFVKKTILYIQNHYFLLWWVDVSHIIGIFVEKHTIDNSPIKSIKEYNLNYWFSYVFQWKKQLCVIHLHTTAKSNDSVCTELLLLAVVGRCITHNCYFRWNTYENQWFRLYSLILLIGLSSIVHARIFRLTYNLQFHQIFQTNFILWGGRTLGRRPIDISYSCGG